MILKLYLDNQELGFIKVGVVQHLKPGDEALTLGLFPSGPHALKDPGFSHGVELFDTVVLLVERVIDLFPGLSHREL